MPQIWDAKLAAKVSTASGVGEVDVDRLENWQSNTKHREIPCTSGNALDGQNVKKKKLSRMPRKKRGKKKVR